jgi:hypothetical protein
MCLLSQIASGSGAFAQNDASETTLLADISGRVSSAALGGSEGARKHHLARVKCCLGAIAWRGNRRLGWLMVMKAAH